MDATHYDFQLRQRLTSSALNAQSAWTSRLTPEALRAIVAGDGGNVSGVLDGLLVTVQFGTLNVQIGGGLALLYDSTQSAPASTHRWIEVGYSAPITATHDAGDGANPRWDVVEIEPGNVAGAGEVLDFYNPNSGAFVPLVAAPLKVCTPTVTIRKGTPNANPKFPDGIDGVIPLAYVYVPAGAVSLLSTDVLYRRPILKPLVEDIGPGAYDASSTTGRSPLVYGGNLEIAVAGSTATIHRQFSGHFSRSGQRFLMPPGTDVVMSANNCDDGLPAANATVYFYAVPPSAVFPTGYNAYLAESEFVIQTASRIASGGYASGQSHCAVIASTTAPAISQRGVPEPATTFDITHPTFGVKSISSNRAVYIGCAYYDFGATQMLAQVAHGAICSASRVSGSAVAVPTAADTLVTMHTNVALDSTYRLPAHIRRVNVQGFHRLDVQGDITVLIKDAIGVLTGIAHRWSTYRSIVADDLAWGINAWMILDGDQKLTINYADGNGTTASNVLRVLQWEDSVIALRC